MLIFGLALSSVWSQTTRYVNPDGNCGGSTPCYTTIQAAINASVDGDIIMISAGTFTETLNVGKSLTFIGSGPVSNPTTIITSTANPMIQLSVTNKNFTFQNLIIEGNVTNNGIWAGGSININSLTLKDFIGRNCQVALYLAEYWPGDDPLTTTVSSLSFDNVTMTNNKFIGVYIGKTVLSGTVTNSTFTGNGYSDELPASWQKTGLQFVNFDEASVPHVVVTNSTFSNNGTGASNIERTGLIIYTAYNALSANEIMTVSGCTFTNHPQYAVRIKNGYNVGNTATVNGTFTNNYLDIWFNNIIGTTTSTTLVRNTFLGTRTVGPGPTYDYNTIQAAINAAAAGDIVRVSDGTYNENVTVNKNISLLSVNGAAVTTIDGLNSGGELGTVYLTAGRDGVTIGDTGQGFTIKGIDGTPGLEKAAIYLQGAQTNITIEGNIIEARGDAGLQGEYNAANDNIIIHNNQFTGQTFTGANPAGVGFAAQFDLPNVPRQLVVFGGGSGTTNTQNINFTNNTVSGIAGGMSITDNSGNPIPPTPQGNTMVTLDLVGTNSIMWNTFSGTTTRYAEALRARGAGTYTITGNNFNGSYPANITAGTTVAATGIARIADAWMNNTFLKGVVLQDNFSNVKINNIPTSIQSCIDQAGSTDIVRIKSGTYIEQVYINKNDINIFGSGKDNTFIKCPATLALATPGGKKPVVYFDACTGTTLGLVTVDGDGKGNANNSFVGVGFWNSGGGLSSVDVIGVRDTPFSGAQHGVGVYAYNNTGGPYSMYLENVSVSDFQKNAFALSGNGLSVTLNGITVTGAGSTSVTAQNGIQIGYGATGSVTNSSVTGIHYIDNIPPVDWTATAILLYDAGNIDISSTTVSNSQTNIYFIDGSGSLNNCTVNNPVADIWANGVDIYASSAKGRSDTGLRNAIQPFIEDYKGTGTRTAATLTINNSTITGIDYAGNYGVGTYAEGTINMTVTNSAVTGWDYAISSYEAGGIVNAIVNDNDLSDNTVGYYYNGTTLQDAEDNWWGHSSGPLDASDDAGGLYNPLGEGGEVSDYVDYDPWYADAAQTYQATTEQTNILNEDQGVYYYTIQDAINGADIGDVLEITGTHNVKNIVVNKGLKIAAAAGGAKFNGLDGTRSGTGFTINTTEPVVFEGATFENYDLAIDFVAFGSARIDDCKFLNCVAAVNNQTTTTIDADTNYWGHATGPLDASPAGLYNPYGQGSTVTDYVDYQPWFNSEDIDVLPVDIAVYNPSCGHIEIRVTPNSNMNGQLTTALFAVKWLNASYPEPAILTNVTSAYNMDFQYYETVGAARYAVFGLETNALVNWTAGTEYVFVEFDVEQNQPEGTVSDFEIANDAWAAANNALYYMEFWGSDYTGYINGFADDVYLADCDLQLHLKAFLQGPYNTTTNEMKTDLNAFIPLNQPFNVAPWNYNGGETIAAVPANMVDWVLVELRSAADGAPAARKAALLFKDGTVKSHVDSFFDVYFTGDFMPNADYFVVLTARNHMPVMSAAVVNIPNAGDRYDFSNMTGYPSYGGPTAQVLLEPGVNGMISGDVNKDGKLIYSGTNNDRDPILAKIVTVTSDPYINGVIQGYYQEDLTMNSWVKYSGSANDQRLIILNIIELTGMYNLNEQYNTVVPGAVVKSGYSNPGTGPVDIKLVEYENSLDVEVTTKADFTDSYVTNIQFTLSWDGNNPMMDAIVDDYVTDYKLEPQGTVAENNGRHYLTFVMAEAVLLPVEFRQGDKLTVLSFDKSSFAGQVTKSTLANDNYTLQTNGDYYISIIGTDQTGVVTAGVTGIPDLSAGNSMLQVYPNPASQGFVNIAFMPETDETVTITLTDVSSRTVGVQNMQVNKGIPVVKKVDISGLSGGIYFINVKGNQIIKTGKVEIR